MSDPKAEYIPQGVQIREDFIETDYRPPYKVVTVEITPEQNEALKKGQTIYIKSNDISTR